MKKMYLLVRNDLPTVYKMVMGGHALAQFALEHPNIFKEWNNRIIVYLDVCNEDSFNYHEFILDEKNIKYSVFKEPDLNNEKAAIAFYSENIFKKLEIAK